MPGVDANEKARDNWPKDLQGVRDTKDGTPQERPAGWATGRPPHSRVQPRRANRREAAAAIPELKSAAALLRGQDDQQYSVTLNRLGFAYAKLNKVNEARDVLSEPVKVSGASTEYVAGFIGEGECGESKGEVGTGKRPEMR